VVSNILFTKEMNKDFIKEIFPYEVIIKVALSKKDFTVCFYEKSTKAYIYAMLKKHNISDEIIYKLTKIKKSTRKQFSKCVKNLFIFFKPYVALENSIRYNSFRIKLTHRICATIIAEEMFKAGFTTKQVSAGLGIHIRKAQRIRKRILENE